MKKRCIVTIFTMVFVFMFLSGSSFADYGPRDWKLKSESKVANNPSLIHFVWEIVQPPYGALDRLTLHRVVDRNRPPGGGQDKEKVIFMLPGTWNAAGWSEITDPALNPMLHLAGHGYDVYTMDYRTVNIPDMDYDQFAANGVDISPTADWSNGVFREDIQTCVDKILLLSHAKKIFMSGFSRGVFMMYIYASKYQDHLKGLVILDGVLKDSPPLGTPLDEATFNQLVALFKAGLLLDPNTQQAFPWLNSVSGLDNNTYNSWKLAGVLPFARQLAGAPLPTDFAVISDFVADRVYHLWDFFGLGQGTLSNYYGGYIDRLILVRAINEFSRYYPNIQTLEDVQMSAYDDVPYLDYDDNDIYLPAIAFLSNLFCPFGTCLQDPTPNMTKSTDVTVNYLPGYGHLDVIFGSQSLADVKTPLLNWLNNHL